MHLNILNPTQLTILQKLKLPKFNGFYLAGGTALALQIGHRTSIDFDFYSQKHFDSNKIFQLIQESFHQAKSISAGEDTLRSEINTTELSIFYYPYPLLNPLTNLETLKVASLPDIGAMKIVAIIQRGTRRDFIDIYFLLKKYSLGEMIQFALKKYPGYQEMLILRSLIYFEDAEKERFPRPIKVLDPNFSWEKAKEKIFAEVKKYQLSMIKKD